MALTQTGGGVESDRKRQIITAALGLFSREGFHRVKMEDIAAEAGIGKGTIYLYFASKEARREEILNRALSAYMAGFREISARAARIVQEGVARGEFRQVKAEMAAHCFLGALHAVVTTVLWGLLVDGAAPHGGSPCPGIRCGPRP